MPVRLPVSQAMECDGLVFTCGQVHLDAAGAPLDPDDLERQCSACLDHVATTLARTGIGWAEVLHLQIFYRADRMPDGLDEATFAGRIAARLPAEAAPVVTLVPLPAFYYPGVAIEIDAIAARHESIAWPGQPGFARHASAAGLVFASEREAAREGPVEAQAEASVGALLAVLEEAGVTPARVAKLTAYLAPDSEPDAAAAAITRIGEAFGRERPTLVPVAVPALAPAPQRVRLSAIALAPGEAGLSRGSAAGAGSRVLSDWPAWTRCGPRVFVGACFAGGEAADAGDIEARTHAAMARLGAALGAAGGAFQDLVEMNTHFVGKEGEDVFHRNLLTRATYFQPPACPSTGVNVPRLWPPEARIVVDGLAVLNDPPPGQRPAREFTDFDR